MSPVGRTSSAKATKHTVTHSLQKSYKLSKVMRKLVTEDEWTSVRNPVKMT